MHIIAENMRSLMLEYEREGYSGNKEGRIFGQIAIKPFVVDPDTSLIVLV